ncbi:metallophosphoesterase family protein [Candidatus Methanomassiliicoccus intestinalis]|uniref:metallophosphoesterase family protein n=1 Tax=Candidatus Methanomassiliicoccus intestinalis TaxID=1406512 RepID=UPI0037DCDAA8
MKFLVLTDIHGNDNVAGWANEIIAEQGVEFVVILGDITQFGPQSWAEEFLAQFSVPVYSVAGNCDPPQEIMAAIEKKAILMHKKKIKIGGIPFIGLGGSNPTIFDTPFELSEDEITASLEPLMEEGAVLVLHAPPLGINDMIPTGAHVGSTAIKNIVEKYHPLLVLSGHIHEARGNVEENGTIFINPGPAMRGCYALIEIDNGHVEAALLERE